MSSEETEVLVVGAGQAGIAMSEHLRARLAHLVVERDRIAERWRSWRWDSLVANGGFGEAVEFGAGGQDALDGAVARIADRDRLPPVAFHSMQTTFDAPNLATSKRA